MKSEHLLPKTLQTAYCKYAALQNEEEKKNFWKKMTQDASQYAPGILDVEIKNGLKALSDRVDELLKQVKQPA